MAVKGDRGELQALRLFIRFEALSLVEGQQPLVLRPLRWRPSFGGPTWGRAPLACLLASFAGSHAAGSASEAPSSKTGRRTSGLGGWAPSPELGLQPRAAMWPRLPQLDLQRVLAPGFVSGASCSPGRCPAAEQGCWDSVRRSGRFPCFLPGVGRLFYLRLGNGRKARPNNVNTTLIQRYNTTFAQLGR